MQEEERRRARGSGAVGCAGLGFLFATAIAVVWRLNDSGPPPPELLRPWLWFVAVLLLFLAAGLFVRLRPRHFVAIDVPAGTATIVRGRAEPRHVPLGEAGPLRHTVEERQVRSGKTWRNAFFHVVRACGLDGLLVHESEDELEARRAAESRSRAWGSPYVLPSGETRTPEELDVPLFQRLGGDEQAIAPLPPAAGSALSVAWREEGYEISTSYRPKVDTAKLALQLLPPLAVAGYAFWRLPPGFLTGAFAGEGGDPVADAVLTALNVLVPAVFLLILVPGLRTAWRAWRRAVRPPTIRVSAAGVRYRGQTVPLPAVEEIERARGAACRVVSDERLLVIDADFCNPSEYEWLSHELRRLVIEAGQRSPLA